MLLFMLANETPGIHITMDMLMTIFDGIKANILSVLPLAISIMVAFLGFRVIMFIISRFTG